MKKNAIALLIVLLTSFSFFTSCELDPVDIDNDDLRNDYVGEWKFTESAKLKSTESQTYIVSISKDPTDSGQIKLENFANPGVSYATVSALITASQIIVSEQTLPNGWVVEGIGKGNANGVMTWTYSIIAGGDKEYFSASAVKQ